VLGDRKHWTSLAACRGSGDLFFAGDPVSQRVALQTCWSCPVRRECEADVRSFEPVSPRRYGVVAGYTAAQRRAWDRQNGDSNKD
jgi:hypothetical protein